ncbi:mCG1027388 [Mus musculus]|nr:mCG1027388 [Mus musculus]
MQKFSPKHRGIRILKASCCEWQTFQVPERMTM